MTTPHGQPPDSSWVLGGGAWRYGQDLTAETARIIMKGGVVGPQGSYNRVQTSIGSTTGNVIPSGDSLWSTFSRNADSTFPRIMLVPTVTSTGSSSGSNSHSHSITFDEPPDYKPAGHGANLCELGFIQCSKDRSYTALTFGTGNSITALGIQAMYATVYKMDPATGTLSLQAQTSDIKASVSSRNTEYTFNFGNSIAAKKSDIFAAGLLQVTVTGQTCKSILALPIWPMAAPPGFRPAALYAYAPASAVPMPSIAYSGLTWNASFVPYYALS
ncbi:hypothetical protein [Nocardia sp. NPDC052566]|uniref:hypothetical protein n=1 Tax=Nocardia sp. NPDC052566 TaxID=3364330 RepID=UPI0037C56E6D